MTEPTLNVEYVSWVAAEAESYFGISTQESIGMTIAEYVPTVLDTICGDPPPRGIFYLVEYVWKSKPRS